MLLLELPQRLLLLLELLPRVLELGSMNVYAAPTWRSREPATSSMKRLVTRSATSIAIFGSRCSNAMLKASLPLTVTLTESRMRSIVVIRGSLPSVP